MSKDLGLRPSDGNSLALSSKETQPSLADDNVVAVWKSENEFMRPCKLAAAMTRSIVMPGSTNAMLSRIDRLNKALSRSTEPVWRRSQATSATVKSIPSTRIRPVSGP
jgi:hypothetical protein